MFIVRRPALTIQSAEEAKHISLLRRLLLERPSGAINISCLAARSLGKALPHIRGQSRNQTL